ncbi:mycothiol-dependent nitroreductase Rv2466c family protein [Williamsia muralis]|uniref:DsbA family protein n=1 Tax=Williamsia marianensis TaxID=85044 RepID=A0ABU4EZN7_WILMA|nr:DsbA family protein [Williamsia muralis]MDV7136718.1 DsbA family protein [Williamsia muralis]
MTTIDFYFDPACPFAWAASRWLVNTAQRRPMTITWRQMSLAILNEGTEVPAKQRHHLEVSQQLGRVLAAAHDASGDTALGPLYTSLGQRLHTRGAPLTTELVIEALTESDMDPQLAAQMNNAVFDSSVRVAHQESQHRLGDTGGSPIVCIDGHCFFGPVLTAIPDATEGDDLFDALLTLAGTRSFAQLQRPHQGHQHSPTDDQAPR